MKNSWINEEFKDLNLGDKRLTERFLKTMNSFELRPEGCINRIFKDEAAARKATYRLFSNDNFTTEKVLDCHTKMTAERMKKHKVVLSLHDSSFFSYNTKASIEGLGNIGGQIGDGEETRGFIGHYALAITEQGLPLGLQAVKTWSRAYESEWDKESERWVETLEDAEKTYSEDTQMVFIADREADQFQILHDSHYRGHSFVIRSKHDRIIQGEDHYLSWHMNKKRVLWDIEIDIPKEKITVEASMKFGEITINDTNLRTNRHLARSGVRAVSLGVIEVKEKTKREGRDQLKWVLFTNLPLKSKEDALKVINYYRLRWQIENYFKVLKDGCCHVEHASLRHFEKLDKYTACFSIIAWRMFWIKFLYHTDPELPAKAILTDLEIEVLRVRHKTIKKEQLTIGEALKYVAMFGGHNGRKGDGPPGNITLWRGFMIVRDRAEYHEELVVDGQLSYPLKTS
jgi:hypothetical protein